METLVNKSLNFLITNSCIEDEITISKIKYGLYVFYSEFSKLILALLLASIVHKLPEALIITALLSVRSFLGGTHCKNYLTCLISSLSIYIIIITLSCLNITFPVYTQILLLVISALIIFKTETPPNPRRNHSKKRKMQNKITAFLLICLFIIISNFIALNLQNCMLFMIIYILLDYLRLVVTSNKC